MENDTEKALDELENILDEESIQDQEVSEPLATISDQTEIIETVDKGSESETIEEDFELELDFADPALQEEKEWKERTGLDEDSLCGAIETIIFMSDRPVQIVKLRNMIDPMMPIRAVHTALERLQGDYELSHHGIRLQEVAEGYQFRTKATYAKFVQDLFKVSTFMLSPTALEVLAIIAYKQPVSRNEIDRIRGVDSSHIVRALMDKRLVKVVGRSEEIGRPVVYGTTLEFLEVFNLKDISELPPEHELEAMLDKNELGKISDIREIVTKGDKERFKFDEIDELDELQQSIKEISTETVFTMGLKSEARKDGDGPKKSAFDLLEEYVGNEEIQMQNQTSGESELLTSVVDPEVIRDLTAGPFNVPEEEEEDDTELIPLSEINAFTEVQEDSEESFLPDTPIDEEIGDLFAGDEESLSAALDDVFDDLMEGRKIDQAELESSDHELKGKEQAIDEITDELIAEGKDFDLDLSFLKEESPDEEQKIGPEET